jgi:hypothetical protein
LSENLDTKQHELVRSLLEMYVAMTVGGLPRPSWQKEQG